MTKATSKTKVKTNYRAPVVAVMGHVDHGKTSILDVIRKSNLAAREYGGITQHIGAYQVDVKGKKITFLDTPGHAAFAQMRSRGGRAADVVILVVAADEGVMPQTKEAISHALAANVPIVVAINKMDVPGANIQKVRQELAQHNVLVEDWGGDVISLPVSAKTGEGIKELLEAVQTVAELRNVTGDPHGELEATIIESSLDRKRGVIVSCIVKNGTLKVGGEVMASGYAARVKSITNAEGKLVKEALPGDPAEILGFSKVPHVGDLLLEKGSELAELSESQDRVEIIGKNAKKMVAVILKADTQGTLEAVKASLVQLVTASVESTYALKILLASTGDVTESDVMLAQSTSGIVIGFNVRIPSGVAELADTYKISVKSYKTIYELLDDAQGILEGTASAAESKIKGRARVLKSFKLPSGDIIAGVRVLAGALKEDARVSIYSKDPAEITELDTPIYSGNIKKLKRGKEEVTVVGKDTECGVLFKPAFEDIQEGQWLEVRS